MKVAAAVFVAALSWLPMVLGQTQSCPADLAASDDCADVINPNACYNEFGFRGAQTLACIEGKDDADRRRKVCKCCGCVGTRLCNWASQNRICTGSTTNTGGAGAGAGAGGGRGRGGLNSISTGDKDLPQ